MDCRCMGVTSPWRKGSHRGNDAPTLVFVATFVSTPSWVSKSEARSDSAASSACACISKVFSSIAMASASFESCSAAARRI